jgi:hypothetical protein
MYHQSTAHPALQTMYPYPRPSVAAFAPLRLYTTPIDCKYVFAFS